MDHACSSPLSVLAPPFERRWQAEGFCVSFHGGYPLLLALISILRPQLCRERLFEAKGDPVPPKRRGEADDSAALRDRIQ